MSQFSAFPTDLQHIHVNHFSIDIYRDDVIRVGDRLERAMNECFI